MKGRICISIILALLLCMTALGAGATTEPFDIEPDAARGAFTVSGTIAATKSNATLMLRFIDENGTEMFVDYTKTKRENDEIVFAFDKIYLPKTLPNGTYTIEVSGPDLTQPLSMEYDYSDPFKVLTALRAIADATQSSSQSVGAALTANNADNAVALGIDISEYQTFTDKGQQAFEAVMKTAEYEIPSGEEDTSQNERELNKLKAVFKQATASALFVMAEDASDVAAWLERFYFDPAPKQDADRDESIEGPDPEANLCIKNEDEDFLRLFNSVKTGQDFVNRFIKADGCYTIAQIKELLNEMALLSAICEQTDSEALGVLKDYRQYFTAIDWNAYSSLSSIEAVKALDAFAGVSYANYAAAADAFNSAVDSVISGSSAAGGNGGSGGSSSSSGSSRSSSVVISGSVAEEKDSVVTQEVFTDLEQAEWARTAILYLYESGIVNGRASGIFSPNATVTRAEFTKMVIGAMQINTEAARHEFTDVKPDDWFAPYVAAAYQHGLVKGDESGCFNPNANITRQDMVTILFRAIGAQTREGIMPAFSDADAISEYARAAVVYFSENGIVNGMGDGSFAPHANATRAQTAVILYKLMTA